MATFNSGKHHNEVYGGMTEEELVEIRTFMRRVLSGKVLQSTGVPGANSSRSIPSMPEARIELQLINRALRDIDPITYGAALVDRTQMKAA